MTIERTQLNNDLFWSFYSAEAQQIIRWTGYADAYWWNKVSESVTFRVKEVNGIKFYLDPKTNEVYKLVAL